MQHKKKEISDQNLLIWLFWAVSLKKYCHIWNQHLWICQHAKFRAKLKILSFGTKNAWFKWMPDFSANLKENYCHILNQQPLISRKGVFVQLVNFGIGSTFSKGPLFLKVFFIKYAGWWLTPEAHLEPSRTSTMEIFIRK